MLLISCSAKTVRIFDWEWRRHSGRLDLTEHRHTGLAQGCSNNRFDGIERAFEREYRVLLIRYASNSNRLRAGIRHRHLDR
jgi:hypothetical protein